MSSSIEFLKQAELALAAYSDLTMGEPNRTNLQDSGRGMSVDQANRFATTYTVLGQYPGADGLSVTLFQEIATGKRYVAIRGTQDGADVWTDIKDIAILGTPERQAQYASLKTKLNEWLADPAKLQGQTFSVAGHSLGGFLAGALLVDFPTQIEHAYLYNAPGVGGLSASLHLLLGLESDPSLDLSRVSNLRASAGASPIAGLGLAWGTPIPVAIENQLDPAVLPNAPSALNHSQQVLTDALAICAAYGGLSPSLEVAQIGSLMKEASNANNRTLEASLDALRVLLIDGDIAVNAGKQTPTGERETYYANLYALQESAGYRALRGSAALAALGGRGADTIAAGAKSDFGAFLAVNYLLPFALEGAAGTLSGIHSGLHAQWQADRSLTPEQKDAGLSNFSDEYLADRAAFLAWKLKLAAEDATADTTAYGKDGAPDAWFRDNASSLTINLGSNWTVPSGKRCFIFDGDAAGTLSGGDKNDRLYGGGDDDVLYGHDDGDRLEGGAGDDTLEGGAGEDVLIGGKGDDHLEGNDGNDVLSGGIGRDVLLGGDGRDLIQLTRWQRAPRTSRKSRRWRSGAGKPQAANDMDWRVA